MRRFPSARARRGDRAVKWIDDPPQTWAAAPEEPPSGGESRVPLRAEVLINGVVVREPESSEAYIYTSDDGALSVDEQA